MYYAWYGNGRNSYCVAGLNMLYVNINTGTLVGLDASTGIRLCL